MCVHNNKIWKIKLFIEFRQSSQWEEENKIFATICMKIERKFIDFEKRNANRGKKGS
jgi:hypothetical protein